jgi:TonB family protein
VTYLVAAVLSQAANAQTPTPPPAAASDGAPSERARRDAEKVFQWIRIHSDKPRKAATTTPVAAERTTAQVPPKKAAKAPDSAAPVTSPPAPVAAAPARAGPGPGLGLADPRRAAPLPPAEAAKAAAPVEEDDLLHAIHRTEPEFPPRLMRTLGKGVVRVVFTVQPDGSVAQPRVLSTSHPRLAQTATATVLQWRFRPLRRAQEAVVDLGFDMD